MNTIKIRLARITGTSSSFCLTYTILDWQSDKDLANISHVIVDEVHERSILVSYMCILIIAYIKDFVPPLNVHRTWLVLLLWLVEICTFEKKACFGLFKQRSILFYFLRFALVHQVNEICNVT